MKKRNLVTFAIIFLTILIAIIIIINPHPETDKEIVKCISGKSTLYIQLGCHACEKQEEIFGDNYQYLNVVDCWFERDKCEGITATPTWIIKGEKYVGVQSIEELINLTGCE